jgi:hypothetical protein
MHNDLNTPRANFDAAVVPTDRQVDGLTPSINVHFCSHLIGITKPAVISPSGASSSGGVSLRAPRLAQVREVA